MFFLDLILLLYKTQNTIPKRTATPAAAPPAMAAFGLFDDSVSTDGGGGVDVEVGWAVNVGLVNAGGRAAARMPTKTPEPAL